MAEEPREETTGGGGTGKGKKDELYAPAERCYVEDGMRISAIARDLGVSDVTLRNWRRDGDWDGQRRERAKNLKELPVSVREIAGNIIRNIARKDADDLDAGDMDKLLKAQKLLQGLRDPRDVMKVSIDVFTRFIGFLGKRRPDLMGADLAGEVDAFLDEIRKESEEKA